ncbi:MAG: BamA/TamA family outer membrane protein [Sinobacteraceae bacterium]|nr:BamA/TamA family outer membrane protein [Nevskiaceae bacterium]
MKATSELESLRKSAPVSPFGLVGRARVDLEQLKTVLESFGFYQGSVQISIDGLALDDARLADELLARPAKPDAQVKIGVTTGPVYHLRKIEIEGNVPPEASKALALRSGAPAVAADMLAAGNRLLTTLQDQGYAFAKVDPPKATEDPTNQVLDVHYRVETGPRVQIGEIRVEGLKTVRQDYVRKRLLLHSGEQFSATRIENARKDLLSVGVFASISVSVANQTDSAGRVPITFTARERPPHAVSINGAYSSDLGISAGVTWTKRDLTGRADPLTLSANAINLAGGTATRGFGYDLSAKYLIPDWKVRNQSLQVSAEAIKQFLDAYDQTAFIGAATVIRQLSFLWRVSAGFSLEQERIEQHECGLEQDCVLEDTCVIAPVTPSQPCTDQRFNYTLLGLPLTALYNDTGQESPLADATHGLRLSLSTTPTFSVGHPSARFFVTQASGAFYFDLKHLGLNADPGRSVLALHGLVGVAGGANTFSLPPDQRFYAGGSGTIRGYRYQSVGPLFPDGNPMGGRAINAGTVEYRQRIAASFGAVAFVDAGSVSRNLSPFNGKAQEGAGVGVRYYTPIGPLRVDVAVPINKRPRTATFRGDDSFEIYIGLGQAF